VIGVSVYHDADELTIGQLLKLPFGKIRMWKDEERISYGDKDELKN